MGGNALMTPAQRWFQNIHHPGRSTKHGVTCTRAANTKLPQNGSDLPGRERRVRLGVRITARYERAGGPQAQLFRSLIVAPRELD